MNRITKNLTARSAGTMLLFAMMVVSHFSFSQKTDSIKHFGGAVTVTNNGVSLLPTFSLGKPAVMFDMNAGNKKLTFEPQLRFGLEGKPWTFLFWWRYKLLRTEKFAVNIGAHPAIAFRDMAVDVNGVPGNVLVAQRYLAGEFSPNYFITKNISVGIYYLHSSGFKESATRTTNFLTINSNFSNIKLSEQFFMRFNPQVFFLQLDNHHGYYATTTITLVRKNFPLSVQSILNKAIQSNIPAKSDFVWNVSLIYSFRKEYRRT